MDDLKDPKYLALLAGTGVLGVVLIVVNALISPSVPIHIFGSLMILLVLVKVLSSYLRYKFPPNEEKVARNAEKISKIRASAAKSITGAVEYNQKMMEVERLEAEYRRMQSIEAELEEYDEETGEKVIKRVPVDQVKDLGSVRSIGSKSLARGSGSRGGRSRRRFPWVG